MREYRISLNNVKKDIYPAELNAGGSNPSGDHFGFSNYYMELNGKPFFGISGEFHFSRYDHKKWEDEIIKMKMAGINIISTYIFWNHHEEEQGVFEWDRNKNLRYFIELCQKHDLYAIIRIGPFVHGEARNGGFPDWLYGRPFDLRANDEEYLQLVRKLYSEINNQVTGLYYKDGGPIIATQIENEYEHAAAPWEMTTGTSNEWLPGGRDGAAHMKTLKEMARKIGIETPFYTATAWGGASAPTEEVVPLWGGYAFWPWIFYGDVKEHPATPEFIFRDFHNDQIKETYGFDPKYRRESIPFACCEMGGGMTVFYKYRFKLPFESVDAMTGIKVAGGCNFVGYYVFHGGSHPKGKRTPFLNEIATPKISYDYQAPLGEFGQVRDSYRRLKRQHFFFQEFEASFSKTKTVLPYDTENMDPTDVDTLRYAVRAHDKSGYVFINNYQDHVETKDQKDFYLNLNIDGEELRIPDSGTLSLAKDNNCMLPFNLDIEGANLRYATTQLLTKMEHKGEQHYFFFTPKGMEGEYCFSTDVRGLTVDNGTVEELSGKTIVRVPNTKVTTASFQTLTGGSVFIHSLTEKDSLNFWKGHFKGEERVIITEANVLADNDRIRLELEDKSDVSLKVFPDFHEPIKMEKKEKEGLFTTYQVELEEQSITLGVKKVSDSKATVHFKAESFEGAKELLLRVKYVGDIGYAFINGELVHDNFCNNDVWEIGLSGIKEQLLEHGMYISVSPLKGDSFVKSDSPMAARQEIAKNQIADIDSISVVAVREIEL
ncbi:beta-galactosidase [Evansella sp. AB-rgal1]|uniref:beta-galactosidase n=1 Tax=Evansella sp. AB-rgal1 TaxID=3242696 RepID=UPI00359D6343